jgi:hypothetical protein
MLEELSTFTFCQPTRGAGLTNRKSASLCQSTIPIVQKLTYSIGQHVLLCEKDIFQTKSEIFVGCDRSQINTTTHIKKTHFKRNEAEAAD